VEAKIDLNRVATFVQVIQAGSFTAAARRLGLPISSVSRAVARLEEDVGVRLLHRTTRKLALTEAGQQYFQRMQTVISEARAATSEVAGRAQEAIGSVRVTAPPGLLELPRLLNEITREHPGLEIDLVVTMRPLHLIEEGIDLAIRGGFLEDSSLIAHRVGTNEFGIVAAPAYLKLRGTPRRPADLKHHECIRFRTRSGIFPWRLEGPGVKKPVTVGGGLICDDLAFVQQAVAAGAGLGLLVIEAMTAELRSGRLVRVLPRYRVPAGPLQVVWASQRLLPARVVLVRDRLIAGLTAIMGSDR
jgi:DNA-binding transcriptional LysR family regulator